MKKLFKNKNFVFWEVLLVFLIIVSAPSLYRVYNLRPLYFSKTIQADAEKAVDALRREYGFAATDLELISIAMAGDGVNYKFLYSYHYPDRNILPADKQIVEVKIKNGEAVDIHKQKK